MLSALERRRARGAHTRPDGHRMARVTRDRACSALTRAGAPAWSKLKAQEEKLTHRTKIVPVMAFILAIEVGAVSRSPASKRPVPQSPG